MTENHDDRIRRAFAEQARGFDAQGLTLSKAELLDWIVGSLPLSSDLVALDVAAGTGILARAIAPHVRHVTAADLTPEMLAEGRRLAEEAAIANVTFEEADAARLPYADASFDLVVCRLALHHFTDPGPKVAEMVRVCRPGGTVGVVDLLSPRDAALSDRYNALERLRDPSHTCALTQGDVVALLESAGVAVTHVAARDVEVVVDAWLALTKAPDAVAAQVKQALDAELSGGAPTGMRPQRRDGGLMFLQTWAVVLGCKDQA